MVVKSFAKELLGIIDIIEYSDVFELYTLIEVGLFAKSQPDLFLDVM